MLLSTSLPRRPAAACRSRTSVASSRSIRLVVLAHGHGSMPHGHGGAATGTKEKQEKEKGFINEMRKVAMKLHTKEQAPKEGGIEAPKEQKPWTPTLKGYLSFLAESKAVYDVLEEAVRSQGHPEYAPFQSTGLERSQGLARDIAWMTSTYGLPQPVLKEDGPGRTYARLIGELAEKDPPAFICHFYNFYFAHTAGGRMIGANVAKSLLNNHQLNFYQWEGDVNVLLDNVRRSINHLAEGWTEAQKQHCLEVTASSFTYSGVIMRCITME